MTTETTETPELETVAETKATTSTKTESTTAGADKPTYEKLDEHNGQLLADNKKYRDKINELKTQARELDAQARKAAELEESIPKIEQQARERVAKADFRARLRAVGIDDPDVLKMVDLSAVKFDDEGEPVNVDEVWTAFQEAKSYLFAGKAAVDTSTSSVHKAPRRTDDTIDWLTATAEEVKAHRQSVRRSQP